MCDIEQIINFHIECPDYIRKFDEEEGQSYIKRQVFNMLLVPYMNHRIEEHIQKGIKPELFEKKHMDKYLEYPEELK
jgi:hypothetical protein